MAKPFEDIRVFCIAQTSVNQEAVKEWLLDLGADEFVAELSNYDDIPDPALLVALAAKQCYMAFQPSLNPNLTRVRKDMVDYLDNILKSGHGSVLEHSVYTFGVNGCSRVFTGENNRHRAGVAISERSMRYVRYENIEYWVPPCFRDVPGLSPAEEQKRMMSRNVMYKQFCGQEQAMADFANIWQDELAGTNFHVKKTLTSAFRRVIGMGIATGGVWTMNLRALRHTIALRTDESAEEEIVEVYKKIGGHMIRNLSMLFGDFKAKGNALVPSHWKV
jgi:thymidylate synthase (FAD)